LSFAGATLAVVFATFAPQDVRVGGRVVALDDDGTAHRELDGMLLLSSGMRAPESVAVRGGRWEALVPGDERIDVVALALGGRRLECAAFGFRPPFDRPVDLVASWARGRELAVVAVGGGAAVEGLELIQDLAAWDERRDPSTLPPEWTVVSGGRSPLQLPEPGHYLVGAPGRAWTRVTWSRFPERRGEPSPMRVGLLPACTLTVVATGGERARPVTLLLERPHGSKELEVRVELPADGRIVLDRLAPGRVRVTALLVFDQEPWLDHAVPLGESTVTLSPETPVELTLPLAETPAGLHDDGTVDRTGRIVRTGAGGPARFTGAGEFTFVAHPPSRPRVDDAREPPMVGAPGGPMFRARKGRDAEARERVAIRDGRFALRVPYGWQLTLRSLILDGRDHDLLRGDLATLDLDTTREPILLAWPADAPAFGDPLPFTLHVVEAGSRLEFRRAHVVLGDHGVPPESRLHPGVIAPEARLVDSAPSPLQLPLPRGSPKWEAWAGADGYAWTPFLFDWNGSAFVELQPGADLVVVIANESLPDGTRLEVRRVPARDEVETAGDHALAVKLADWWNGTTPLPDPGYGERVVDDRLDDARTLELTGVPRAQLLVALSIRGSEGTRWIAFAPVDARGGGRHEVVLAAPESLLPAFSRLGGTLFVPPEWRETSPLLSLAPHHIELLPEPRKLSLPLSTLRAIGEKPGLYAWECGSLMNGTWVAAIEPFGVAQSIEVGPAGRDDVALVVPPPADLRLECVDAITGLPIPGTDYGLALATPGDAAARGVGRRLQRGAGVNPLWTRVPVGTLDVDVDPAGYAPLRQSVVVPPGGAAVKLRCWRDLGIKVRWTEGDAAIEQKAGRATEVIDADGNDVLVNVPDSWPRGMTLELARPGRHRVVFPKLRGYQAIAPVEVEARAGEYVELKVELVPEERR